MRISKDRVVRTVVLVAAAALLSACNTVKGLGKDIHYAGEKTEEALSR